MIPALRKNEKKKHPAVFSVVMIGRGGVEVGRSVLIDQKVGRWWYLKPEPET